jgi:hypothetical protein
LAGILEWSHNVSAWQAMYNGNVNSDVSKLFDIKGFHEHVSHIFAGIDVSEL